MQIAPPEDLKVLAKHPFLILTAHVPQIRGKIVFGSRFLSLSRLREYFYTLQRSSVRAKCLKLDATEEEKGNMVELVRQKDVERRKQMEELNMRISYKASSWQAMDNWEGYWNTNADKHVCDVQKKLAEKNGMTASQRCHKGLTQAIPKTLQPSGLGTHKAHVQ